MKVTDLTNRLRTFLLISLLITLPFAEWKFIGLPLRGRPLLIDFNAYLSVSIFEILFVPYSILCIPVLISLFRTKSIRLPHYLFVFLGFALFGYLIYQQNPTLPLLTPILRNVIDARQFLIHFVITVVFAIGFTTITWNKIVKYGFYYYTYIAIGAIVLSWAALKVVLYFNTHYPFQNPAVVSFPFPSQNQIAGFLAVSLLGAIGFFLSGGKGKWLIVVLPQLILAIGLTGSRSAIFLVASVIVFSLLAHAAIYYFGLKNRNSSVFAKQNPALILPGVFVGLTLLLLNINLPPINDSLSIFKEVIINPIFLLTDSPESPRQRVWKTALSDVSNTDLNHDEKVNNLVPIRNTFFDESKYNTEIATPPTSDPSLADIFQLNIILVKNGCKEVIGSIDDIIVGRSYKVVIEMMPSGINSKDNFKIIVFDNHNKAERQSVEFSHIDLPQLNQFHLFLANSDKSMVSLTSEISNFSYELNDILFNVKLDSDPRITIFENPYNGGAEPTISVSEDNLIVNAPDRYLRGHVTVNNLQANPESRISYSYDFLIKRVLFQWPIEFSGLFYTGFSDMPLTNHGGKWDGFSNALLIQYERKLKTFEPHLLFERQREEFRVKHSYNINPDQLETDIFSYNNEVKCGVDGKQYLSNLWRVPITFDIESIKDSQPSQPSQSKNDGNPDQPEPLRGLSDIFPEYNPHKFTEDLIFSLRGSTHNVYLDFVFYNGIISLSIFIIFIATLFISFISKTWYLRKTKFFVLYSYLIMQLIIIFAQMYAQPYIFHKYIWVQFGLTLGLTIIPKNSEYQT